MHESFDHFFNDEKQNMFLFTIYNNGMVYTFEVSKELLREISSITHIMHDSTNRNFDNEFNSLVERYLENKFQPTDGDLFHSDDDNEFEYQQMQDKKRELLYAYIEKFNELKDIKANILRIEQMAPTNINNSDFNEFVKYMKSRKENVNTPPSGIARGPLGMPSVSDGNFEIFEGLPPEIRDRVKEKEHDIEFKQKKIIESVKSDYVKFLYNDEETLKIEINNLKKKIFDLIDNDKYEAAEILKERVNVLESKLKSK